MIIFQQKINSNVQPHDTQIKLWYKIKFEQLNLIGQSKFSMICYEYVQKPPLPSCLLFSPSTIGLTLRQHKYTPHITLLSHCSSFFFLLLIVISFPSQLSPFFLFSFFIQCLQFQYPQGVTSFVISHALALTISSFLWLGFMLHDGFSCTKITTLGPHLAYRYYISCFDFNLCAQV